MASYTYCRGFHIKTWTPITTKKIVALIDALHASFGPGWRFAPEAITEGGIVWLDWPGKKDGEYKTLRFQVHPRGNPPWPHITDTTLDEWRAGHDDTLIWPTDYFRRKLEGATFLKSFYGAPCWTMVELSRFRDAFLAAGIGCLKKMPTATSLCSNDSSDLGTPLKRAHADALLDAEEPPAKQARKE